MVIHIEMVRGEDVVGPRQHKRFTGHAVAGTIIGAAIVAILFSLT